MINHLAVIMDGNRRWARERGKFPWYGHKAGIEAVQRVVDFCLKKNISYLSLYTFSLENFNRSAQEYSYLFSILAQAIAQETDRLVERGVRVRFVGDRSLFPSNLRPVIDELERKTAHLDKLMINCLFCYGGQQEIVAGVRTIVRKIKDGQLAEADLSVETFQKHLWLKECPPPDLVIRTGGARRLSNFLLFHAAYSELYFMDCLWPDISEHELQEATDYFQNCQRKFGT